MPTKNLTNEKPLQQCFYCHSHWLMLCHWFLVFSICFFPSFSCLGWQRLGKQNFNFILWMAQGGRKKDKEGGWGRKKKKEGRGKKKKKEEGGGKKKEEEEEEERRRWLWCKGNFCIRSKIHLSKAPVSSIWKQMSRAEWKSTASVGIHI